jgi:hypothetical protein
MIFCSWNGPYSLHIGDWTIRIFRGTGGVDKLIGCDLPKTDGQREWYCMEYGVFIPRLFHTTHGGLVATNPVTMDLLVDRNAVYNPRGKGFSAGRAGEWPDTGMYFTYSTCATSNVRCLFAGVGKHRSY